MAISRPMDRHFFVTSVKTTGGSINLAKGQLAIVDPTQSSEAGAAVLSSFVGIPKTKKKLQIRVGGNNKSPNRSYSDKSMSTPAFSLSQIKRLLVSYPERTEQSLDEVVIGYDGFDPNTAFNFKKGQAPFHVTLEVKGGALQYRGAGEAAMEILNFVAEIPGCDPYENCEECDECEPVDCREVVEELVTRMRNHEVSGGHKLQEFVDIIPVFSCDENPEVDTTDMTWYTLQVCDTGDNAALNLVQAQYDVPVVRINRVGAISTYQLMATASPDDFETSTETILKGCASCPDGWDEIEGGYVYVITIEDNGTAYTTQITNNLASSKYISGTLQKQGNNAGVGFYTALYSSPITPAEIATFVSTSTNNRNTATVDLVGEKPAFCDNDSSDQIAWVEGDSCQATTQEYSIVLPDTECGEDRLAELVAQYPSAYDIAIGTRPAVTYTITVTAAGAGELSIGGVDFSFSAGGTAALTAANIEAAIQGSNLIHSVSRTGAVLTIIVEGGDAVTVSAVEGSDFEATNTNAASTVEDRRACQTRYVATMVTNLVCEECDPVFKDFWVSQAPAKFDNFAWYLTPGQDAINPNTNCLCGIRFKGKPFVISAEEALRDTIQFQETATQIQVAAGYPAEIREGIGHLFKGEYSGKYLSRHIPRTHLMGNLRDLEKESRAYFLGEVYRHDYTGRVLRAEESVIQDNLIQVAQFSLEIENSAHTQGPALTHSNNILYSFYIPFGAHQDLAALLNNMAGAAGIEELI